MLYQTHAFDAKLDHNGCVWYIRLIFNGYCFVGDAVFVNAVFVDFPCVQDRRMM